MSATVAVLCSRPLALEVEPLAAGDQVNIANDNREPAWRTILAAGYRDEDPGDHPGRLDGCCLGVLTLEPIESGDAHWWRIQPHEGFTVRVACQEGTS
jgi:hypothetical protein